MSVVSRAFTLLIDNKEVLAMAPFADSANHYWNGAISSKVFDNSSRKLVLTTTKSTGPNEEIFLQYSELNNWQLLMCYGFVLHENPFDSIHFSIENEAKEEDVALALKKVIL
jgi:hypothetical protein